MRTVSKPNTSKEYPRDKDVIKTSDQDDTINVTSEPNTDQIFTRAERVLNGYFLAAVPPEGGSFRVPIDGATFNVVVEPK